MHKNYNILGLCQKAGKLVSGEFSAEKAVKELKAVLVIVASDASDNTKKLFRDKCAYRNIPCIVWGTKEELGQAIGKRYRATVALLDIGFKNTILKNLEEETKSEQKDVPANDLTQADTNNC